MSTSDPALPRNAPVLVAEEIRKRFGDLEVLRGLSLEVSEGEIVACIGPSGSGKSTFLRVLMTLEKLDGGRFTVCGDTVTGDAGEAALARARRHLGVVFQHFNLFPHRTALGNVTLALEVVHGMSRDAARERAMELLERVGIADKANQHPSRLSGGQKQRVAIARALAPRPTIVLFDEITSALDPELVGEVLGVLRDIASERATTMLIVTHEIPFAREIADRIVFFDEGKILAQMRPEELDDPPHPRIRDFLRTVTRPGIE